jgi:hypothetical protein
MILCSTPHITLLKTNQLDYKSLSEVTTVTQNTPTNITHKVGLKTKRTFCDEDAARQYNASKQTMLYSL